MFVISLFSYFSKFKPCILSALILIILPHHYLLSYLASPNPAKFISYSVDNLIIAIFEKYDEITYTRQF